MRETAYAKLNLALHVRAREPDGYHRIETVFAFAQDGDVLEAGESSADAVELAVTGPFAGALSEHRDNLVVRAAEALREAHGIVRGVHLRLDKLLPVSAGIGGGSADAAAALRLLMRWWNLPAGLEVGIAAKLGADVPACLASHTVRGEGRGDILHETDGAPVARKPVLLVNPRVAMPTGPVFAAWDCVDRGPLGAALLGRNDLEAPARSIAPVIGEVLEALAGAEFASMSGSGATCFGLYSSAVERDAAATRIAAERPGWWLLKSRLR